MLEFVNTALCAIACLLGVAGLAAGVAVGIAPASDSDAWSEWGF